MQDDFQKALNELNQIIPNYQEYIEGDFEKYTLFDLWNDVQYEIALYQDKLESLITKTAYKSIIAWSNKYEYVNK
jgi:hypothetical protein